MFTQVALYAKFTGADGSPASGTLTAKLSSRITNPNGPSVVIPSVISGTFDNEGRLIAQNGEAFILDATDDAGTYPVGAYYTFTMALDSVGLTSWDSPLPCQATTWEGVGPATVVDADAICTAASAVVQLVDTIAATSMIGQVVTSAHFTGTPTVLSIDAVANTLTLSEVASTTGNGITYGKGIFPVTTLMENAL
jgi:hypothetical protein